MATELSQLEFMSTVAKALALCVKQSNQMVEKGDKLIQKLENLEPKFEEDAEQGMQIPKDNSEEDKNKQGNPLILVKEELIATSLENVPKEGREDQELLELSDPDENNYAGVLTHKPKSKLTSF